MGITQTQTCAVDVQRWQVGYLYACVTNTGRSGTRKQHKVRNLIAALLSILDECKERLKDTKNKKKTKGVKARRAQRLVVTLQIGNAIEEQQRLEQGRGLKVVCMDDRDPVGM